GPPRIPFAMGGKEFPSDIRVVQHASPPGSFEVPWQEFNGYWECVDQWGNVWRRLEGFTKGEVYKGVIQDGWDLLDTYEFPRMDEPRIYEAMQGECQAFKAQGYYVLGMTGWPFGVARYMRGMENFLADTVIEKNMVMLLLEKVAAVLEREIICMADNGVDGILTGEDWGTQDRLLVSPACWREMFKPHFIRLCNVAHERGLTVWFHSCGYIRDVLEDWVEAGIDVCQFDQPELHGIDYLSENFRGRMNFWCPVDVQRTLQTRDAGKIEAAARNYVEKLGCYGGGFIAGYYRGNEALGLEARWQEVAGRAFMKYGDPAPIRCSR
ncbi:MAG: uroporphyrinogen decarboxylase family protein, partial [bacterium]|nr:uroporphyrinogen decarboxylase family protein [bacterium]